MSQRLVLAVFLTTVLMGTFSHSRADAPEQSNSTVVEKGEPENVDWKRTAAELEASLPSLLDKARVPGLQVALIDDGAPVWEGSFGVSKADGETRVTTTTIFEAASLTKPLFAYVVVRMADKGLIDLDKPLIDLLSRAQMEQYIGHSLDKTGFRSDWIGEITARHVLSHSAGTPHGARGETFTIAFEPGTDWKYSAEGYGILQMVVEEIEGKPLEAIVDDYAIEPLGMEHSSMVWRGSYEKSAAHGHWLYGDPVDIRRRSRAGSAATLYTTAGDYARFVSAVLAGTGLKPETAKEMLSTVIEMNDDGSLGWSLGFGTQIVDETTAIWQWGDYGVFRCYVIADLRRRAGVVFLSNSFNGLSLCSTIVRIAVGLEAMGCEELGYAQIDSPAYDLYWDLETKGPKAADRLPILVDEHPDVFTDDRLRMMAEVMELEEMYEEAGAIYAFTATLHPNSGVPRLRLARLAMLTGDLADARQHFKAALSAPEEPADPKSVEWALSYIKAIEDPAELEIEYLEILAGDYGPRHLTAKGEDLFYAREDADTTKPRPLLAISRDTFVIEGEIAFRLEVEFDDDGNPSKLVGVYESGARDETPRNR